MAQPARLCDRFTAFAVDLFLVLAFCILLANLIAAYHPVYTLIIFVLYHVVLRTGGRRTLGQYLSQTAFLRKVNPILAWVLGIAMASFPLWVWLAARRHAQLMLISNAQLGLQALARIDTAYRQRTGAYAPDLDTLLKASGYEVAFRLTLAQTVDMTTLKLEGGPDSYVIEAVALDESRTKIKVHNVQLPASSSGIVH
jgi:hypothetical protein